MNRRLVLLSCLFPFSVFAAEIPFEKTDAFPERAYDLIAEKRVIWLGEMHGTQEAPQLLLGLVKLISRRHVAPPVVALEIPDSAQPAIDGYMVSGDAAFLRASAFFKKEFRDGRSSQALVRLLSDLRKEKPTAVFCFDPAGAKTAQERDTMMAENLRSTAERFPSAKLVVLSGNVHSQIVKGTDWDPSYRSAAFELSHTIASLVSFSIAYEAGTAWVRTESGFGEHPLHGTPWDGTAPCYIALYPELIRGHNGLIFTRTLTGSPPWE